MFSLCLQQWLVFAASHGGEDKAGLLTCPAAGFQQGERLIRLTPQASLTELAVLSALVAQGMNVVDQCPGRHVWRV